MPNVIEIKETFCGRTDARTDEHLRATLLGQLRRVKLKMSEISRLTFILRLGIRKCSERNFSWPFLSKVSECPLSRCM